MALLDEVVSLKGFVSISTLFAIKFFVRKLKITRNTRIESPNIHQKIEAADRSNVQANIIINYNQQHQEEKKKYTLLVNVLAVLLITIYSSAGQFLTSMLPLYTILMAGVSIYGVVRLTGAAKIYAVEGFFYFGVNALTALFIYVNKDFLFYAHENSHLAFAKLQALIASSASFFKGGYGLISILEYINQNMAEVFGAVSSMFGVVVIFISSSYCGFGYLKIRNFDDAVMFVFNSCLAGLIGFFLASGSMLALILGNWAYIGSIWENTLSNF